MSKQSEKAKPGTFVIAETASSSWNYHLRRIGEDGKLFPNGNAPPAVCGRALGWDTKIPLTAWGKRSHIPETWCLECAQGAGDSLVRASVLPALDIARNGLKSGGWIATTDLRKLQIGGRALRRTAAEAAKQAGAELWILEQAKLAPGSTFMVGEALRSSTYISGVFTEVWVVERFLTYVVGKDGRPRQQRRPRK